MKSINSPIFKTLSEAAHIITSKERIKELFHIPLYSNAFYLMLSTIISAILGFLFWIIVAKFYTEAEVGLASAIIASICLLSSLGYVGLNFSLIRFLPHAEKPQDLINTCFTLSGLISVVLAGIFIAGLQWWSPALAFIKESAVFSLAFVAFVLLWTLSYFIEIAFIARRRAGFVLSKNIIIALLRIPLPILLVAFFHTFGIVASWAIAVLVAVAISLFLFLPKVQKAYKPVPALKLNLIKGVWRYSGANYLAQLFSIAPSTLFPIMVVNLLSPESNAYFYIAWMVASLLPAIPLAVSQSLFAEGSHFEEKLGENVGKSLKFTFLLLIPAVILLVCGGKWLLLIFGQTYSSHALSLLRILAISSLPLGINYIYSSILQVTGRIKELVGIWAFIALATLLTSYLILPTAGIIGLGYVWLGVNSLVALYIIFFRRLWQVATQR
jgi:O-antigen/teichoic acid export membrane protein